MWEIAFDKSDRKKYLNLIDYVIDCINTGKLKFGETLPTQRELSKKLGLSIGTITKAFNELIRLGYLSGEIGRGTFVKDFSASYDRVIDPDNAGVSKYNFGHFKAPEYAGPGAQMVLMSGIHETVHAEDFFYSLNDSFTGGTKKQKESAQQWMELVGVKAPSVDNILITSAVTHSVSLALLSFCKPNDVVLMEEICNPVVRDQVLFHHMRLQGVAVDDDGIIPESLEEMILTHRPRLLITNPTINNPVTYTTSLERRKAIAEVASRHDIKIVETGYLDHFHDKKPASYFDLIPDKAIYLTSLSNSINTALRFGMVAGSKADIEQLNIAMRLSVWMTSHLTNEIACNLIDSGKALEILTAKKKLAAKRNQLLSQALSGYAIHQYVNSFHAWLQLPEHWKSLQFKEEAFEQDILVRNGELFDLSQNLTKHVRLSLGAIASDLLFEEGLKALSGMLKNNPKTSIKEISKPN